MKDDFFVHADGDYDLTMDFKIFYKGIDVTNTVTSLGFCKHAMFFLLDKLVNKE